LWLSDATLASLPHQRIMRACFFGLLFSSLFLVVESSPVQLTSNEAFPGGLANISFYGDSVLFVGLYLNNARDGRLWASSIKSVATFNPLPFTSNSSQPQYAGWSPDGASFVWIEWLEGRLQVLRGFLDGRRDLLCDVAASSVSPAFQKNSSPLSEWTSLGAGNAVALNVDSYILVAYGNNKTWTIDSVEGVTSLDLQLVGRDGVVIQAYVQSFRRDLNPLRMYYCSYKTQKCKMSFACSSLFLTFFKGTYLGPANQGRDYSGSGGATCDPLVILSEDETMIAWSSPFGEDADCYYGTLWYGPLSGGAAGIVNVSTGGYSNFPFHFAKNNSLLLSMTSCDQDDCNGYMSGFSLGSVSTSWSFANGYNDAPPFFFADNQRFIATHFLGYPYTELVLGSVDSTSSFSVLRNSSSGDVTVSPGQRFVMSDGVLIDTKPPFQATTIIWPFPYGLAQRFSPDSKLVVFGSTPDPSGHMTAVAVIFVDKPQSVIIISNSTQLIARYWPVSSSLVVWGAQGAQVYGNQLHANDAF
jgi:hypothetical protein